MTLQYSVTMDDLLQFSQKNYARTAEFKRSVRNYRLRLVLALVIAVCLGVQVFLTTRDAVGSYIYVAVVMLALVALAGFSVFRMITAQKVMLKAFLKGARRMYENEPPTLVIGEFTLQVDGDTLTRTGQQGKSEYPLASFTSVEKDEGGVYLYIGGNATVIVPANAFKTPEEREEFVTYFKKG